MNPKLLLLLAPGAVVLLFLLQNLAIVEVQFLFWSLRMPRAVLMLLLLGMGTGAGWLLHSWHQHRNR